MRDALKFYGWFGWASLRSPHPTRYALEKRVYLLISTHAREILCGPSEEHVMNFPSTQKTGRRAELAVEDYFTSWNWNVGHDHIDIGYDLFITPDQSLYQGLRFLVQVKGTSVVAKNKITVSIAKERLRQYARDLLPVFIVRAAADGTLYWLHAQAWAKDNQGKIAGNGKCLVTFDPTKTLADRAQFEDYLNRTVRPLLRFADILSVRNADRQFILHESGLNQEKSLSGDVLDRPILNPKTLQAEISFRPLSAPENIKNLRDAIEYGFPRSLEVEDFKINPPIEAPDLIKTIDLSKGTLTVKRTTSKPGYVLICPGEEYSVLAQEICFAVDLFRGSKGAGISNELHLHPLDLSIRMLPDNNNVKTNINLSIRTPYVCNKPLNTLSELSPLAAWAEQIAAKDSMSLAFLFGGIREELSPAVQSTNSLLPLLQKIRSLSRLHMVARTLKSDFMLADSDHFSHEDFQDIDLAFELLRGEKKFVNFGPAVINLADQNFRKEKHIFGEFVCKTNWNLTVADKPVGDIPVQIQLPNYVLEELPDTSKVRIAKGEHGQAWMLYEKHSA